MFFLRIQRFTCSGTTPFRSASSAEDAPPFDNSLAAAAVLEALSPLSSIVPVSFAVALAEALKDSSSDILMLLEILLLVSVSDSEATVEADADLLSLAAALALSLELALWLTLSDVDSEREADWLPETRTLSGVFSAAASGSPAGVSTSSTIATLSAGVLLTGVLPLVTTGFVTAAVTAAGVTVPGTGVLAAALRLVDVLMLTESLADTLLLADSL